MGNLFDAINEDGLTFNGCVTNASSLNKNCDLFFLAGASRGKDITHVFAGALAEDPEVACRVLEWCRDSRGGAGERQTFRNLFSYLIKNEPKLASKILRNIPEIGRFDDIIETCFGTTLERQALGIIATALKAENALAAKWVPRNGPAANKIRSYMKMVPKDFRKMLVNLSKTVEQQMCANEWDQITYSHVPSVAAARYQKAFGKHDPLRYGEYKNKLSTGEEKINASVVYPYDIIRSLKSGDNTVANAQWASLPDYLNGTNENILPVVDVSGSMTTIVSGSVTALDVAISLGLYTSERLTGVFKDTFVTFSSVPKMVKLTGTLSQRYDQMSHGDWQMSTDLQAVFKLILNSAVKHQVPVDEMPSKIVIFSDMQFNNCVSFGGNITGSKFGNPITPVSVNAMDMIRLEFQNAGYKLPTVIFWNLNGDSGNSPVKFDETGTALVSGFSPAIMKNLLGGEDMSPLSIMLKTVMIQRYDF